MAAEGQERGREPTGLASGGRSAQVEVWCAHMQALVNEAFRTRGEAAARVGKSETWLSRGLNARGRRKEITEMPKRDFVKRVLDACEVSGEVRERTQQLYMEALATVDEAQHAVYQVSDRMAAAEDGAKEALRAMEDLRARLTQQEEQHAREVARLKSEAEQHARDVARLESEAEQREEERAADLAAAREREQRWVADLGAAQASIGEVTEQLAAERRGRRVERATIEALREQLAQAQATIEEIREEPCRHDREEAVLAEAIAITEQALAAERERAELEKTAALEEEQEGAGRRKPAAGPVAVGVVGFVVMVLGALTGLAVVMHPKSAAELDWAVVRELRGSTAAGFAALAAVVLGFSAWLGAMMTLLDRGYIPDRPHDTQPDYATWI